MKNLAHLNYYLSFDVCASFRVSVLSVCLSANKNFLSKMDQIRKFGEQTSRILEFKPEGLDIFFLSSLLRFKREFKDS